MKGRDEEEETPLLPTIREQKAQTARKQKWQAGSINKLLPRKKMNTITRRAPVKLPNAPSLSLSLKTQNADADADAHVEHTYKAATSSPPLATNSGPLNNVRATRQAQV